MAEILDVLKTVKITKEAIYETESLLTNDLLFMDYDPMTMVYNIARDLKEIFG